jgi:four helix bundle protein
MTEPRSHRDLVVWQKATDLAVLVYEVARGLRPDERYGLWSQVTRAASSIPMNIAEGHGRQGPREFANFLSIARGSLAELDTGLEICARLHYVDRSDLAPALALAIEVGKMITALRKRLIDGAGS